MRSLLCLAQIFSEGPKQKTNKQPSYELDQLAQSPLVVRGLIPAIHHRGPRPTTSPILSSSYPSVISATHRWYFLRHLHARYLFHVRRGLAYATVEYFFSPSASPTVPEQPRRSTKSAVPSQVNKFSPYPWLREPSLLILSLVLLNELLILILFGPSQGACLGLASFRSLSANCATIVLRDSIQHPLQLRSISMPPFVSRALLLLQPRPFIVEVLGQLHQSQSRPPKLWQSRCNCDRWISSSHVIVITPVGRLSPCPTRDPLTCFTSVDPDILYPL